MRISALVREKHYKCFRADFAGLTDLDQNHDFIP